MSLEDLQAMPEGRYEVRTVAEAGVVLLVCFIADRPVAAIKLTGKQARTLGWLLFEASEGVS